MRRRAGAGGDLAGGSLAGGGLAGVVISVGIGSRWGSSLVVPVGLAVIKFVSFTFCRETVVFLVAVFLIRSGEATIGTAIRE